MLTYHREKWLPGFQYRQVSQVLLFALLIQLLDLLSVCEIGCCAQLWLTSLGWNYWLHVSYF